MKEADLDHIDMQLLDVLSDNARTSVAELARQVGLSSPSVAERVKRLEERGVIRGYAAAINPEALGLPLAAWLRVRPIPGKLQKVAELLRELPEIVECDRVTGDDCFIARVNLSSMAHLESVIDRIIPYATTNTAIIQSSLVSRKIQLGALRQGHRARESAL